jgi:membrane protein YdbS with pleckstrin-like domain
MTTQFDQNIPADFEAILDKDEKILWLEKPVFIPYILTSIWKNLFLLLFGVGYISALILNHDFATKRDGSPEYFLWILSCIFLFGGILGILKAFLNFSNTAYAYSSKRVMIRSGFIGTDFKTIDFDKIANSEVNVNIVERIYDVGSVNFSTGETTSKGELVNQKFTSIKNPYQVFKMVKQIGVDIKTDYNYPNALRPEKNPGYKTTYDPE